MSGNFRLAAPTVSICCFSKNTNSLPRLSVQLIRFAFLWLIKRIRMLFRLLIVSCIIKTSDIMYFSLQKSKVEQVYENVPKKR